MVKLSLFIILLLLSISLFAHETQTELCAKQGVVDRKCMKRLVNKLDHEVSSYYSKALNSLKSEIKSDINFTTKQNDGSSYKQWLTKRLNYLKQSQIAYIEYRELLCDAEQQRYEGGSLASNAAMSCLIERAILRKNWLNRVYLQD